MLESFGARLRQRREEQAIPLVTIAEETKIKRSLLEALERDDVSQWPSGIFRRAFIRAYAHAIRLNPDEVVREFLEIYPDPVEDVASLTAIATAVDGPAARDGAPRRFRFLVGSAIGSLSRLRPNGGHASSESARIQSADTISGTVDEAIVGASALHQPLSPDINVIDDIDIVAVAELCTAFGLVEHADEVPPLLQEAAALLGAVGLIVWIWDGVAAELRAVLAHGYSDQVLAQLPTVRRDADNATAAAFRSGQVCAMKGSLNVSGALVVPLLTPSGCAGVFAIELPHGAGQTTWVRAVATIVAAQLAQLVSGAESADVSLRASH